LPRSEKLRTAVTYVETQSVEALNRYFDRQREAARSSGASKADQRLVSEPKVKEAMRKADSYDDLHPKFRQTRMLLAQTLGIENGERVIVFTESRDTAETLVEFLGNHFAVQKFVGQSDTDGSDGMTQTEQQETLDRFRAGEFEVLVSTSVAEEGLDVPEVDLVLFYEPVPTAIRSIQRKGRTGRQTSGKVHVLLAEDTRDEAYFWKSRQDDEAHGTGAPGAKSAAAEIKSELGDDQAGLDEYENRKDDDRSSTETNGEDADSRSKEDPTDAENTTASGGTDDAPERPIDTHTGRNADEGKGLKKATRREATGRPASTPSPGPTGQISRTRRTAMATLTVVMMGHRRDVPRTTRRGRGNRRNRRRPARTRCNHRAGPLDAGWDRDATGDAGRRRLHPLGQSLGRAQDRQRLPRHPDGRRPLDVRADRRRRPQLRPPGRRHRGQGPLRCAERPPQGYPGALASLAVDFGASILRTSDETETADLLETIARREQETGDREVDVHGESPGRSPNSRVRRLLRRGGRPGHCPDAAGALPGASRR